MIHVIDKMDSPKIGGHSNNGLNKIGRSISLSRSRSPQPSQSRHPSNGTENTVSESNSVPTDNIQKLSLDNCNLSVVEPDMSIQVLSDRNGEVNEGAVLFDDSDITPPSPLLSNTFPPSSLLPSNSVYLNNLKTEEAYALPYKFNDMKLKQEVSKEVNQQNILCCILENFRECFFKMLIRGMSPKESFLVQQVWHQPAAVVAIPELLHSLSLKQCGM